MASGSWARSGQRPAPRQRPPVDALALAIEEALGHWARLTGSRPPLSDAAASAVVQLALALWPAVAAVVQADEDGP